MTNATDYTNMQSTPQDPASSSDVDTDLMIDDLSYQDAKEYVLRFLVSEKRTETMLREKQHNLNTWNERLAFAEQKGMAELAEKARQHLHGLIQEKDKMAVELDVLRRKNIILKEKLALKAKTAGVPSNAFAEQLLADLGQLADVEEYKLQEAMKQHEAEDELAKLKAKLGM